MAKIDGLLKKFWRLIETIEDEATQKDEIEAIIGLISESALTKKDFETQLAEKIGELGKKLKESTTAKRITEVI